jgi:large subunit ribosomal protein L2
VKVVNAGLHKGAPVASLVEPQKRGSAATTTATSPPATRAAATSTLPGRRLPRNKDGIPAKVERLEYDPNRSANLALLLYADGERRYVIAPRGVAVGTQLLSGSEAGDQARQLPAAAQHPGRHDDPLHRDAAGQGRADRPFGRRLGAAARARRHLRAAALRSGEIRKVHVDCRAVIGEVGNEEHNLRSIGKAGANRWRGIRPTVRGDRDEPGRPPDGRPHQRRRRTAPPDVAVGPPAKGYKTRKNKRTDGMIVRRRHATKG